MLLPKRVSPPPASEWKIRPPFRAPPAKPSKNLPITFQSNAKPSRTWVKPSNQAANLPKTFQSNAKPSRTWKNLPIKRQTFQKPSNQKAKPSRTWAKPSNNLPIFFKPSNNLPITFQSMWYIWWSRFFFVPLHCQFESWPARSDTREFFTLLNKPRLQVQSPAPKRRRPQPAHPQR